MGGFNEPQQQTDLFEGAQKRARGELDAIDNLRAKGLHLEAAHACGKRGDYKTAFNDYKNAAHADRNAAHKEFEKAIKQYDGKMYGLTCLGEAQKHYDRAAMACEEALTLAQEHNVGADRNKQAQIAESAFKMWHAKAQSHRSSLTLLERLHEKFLKQLSEFPESLRDRALNNAKARFNKKKDGHLSSAITAFSNALEYCTNDEEAEKLRARIEDLEKSQQEISFAHDRAPGQTRH